MVTIILDSSNIFLNVGVAKDDVILDYISYEAWQKQSEYMVVELATLLKRNNIDKKDIKQIIVSIGPGSYTGVRIALTIAKTIAVALNINICPISSLRAQKNGNETTISVINARGGRSYFGVYKGKEIIVDETILTNDEVIAYIDAHPSYCLSGDTKYLDRQSVKVNVIEQMFDLKDVLTSEDPLTVKPSYMKDSYAKPLY